MAGTSPGEHVKSVIHNTIGSTLATLLLAGGLAVILWIKGLPFHWALMLGVGSVLTLSLSALLVSVARNYWLRKRDDHQVISGQTEIEQALIKTNAELANLQQKFGVLQANEDEFKWLREIADTQSRSIADYIRAECWIMDAWLSQESPYIDFRFKVSSCCVYKVSVVGIGGSISFGFRRLTLPLTVTHNLVQRLSIGENGFLTITQPLSKEDAAFILNNREQRFYVSDFSLRLEATPPIDESLNLKLNPLVGQDATWEKYPKLKMQIKATYFFVVSMQDWEAHEFTDIKPAVITLEIEIENPRNEDVQIDAVRLATVISGRRIVSTPELGDIHEEWFINREGVGLWQGKPLKNLGKLPFVVFGLGKVSGHLQFTLENVGVLEMRETSSVLTLTDRFSEQHTESCKAVSKRADP